MTPPEARQQLKASLLKKPGDLATASKAIGRNHAYLQQFIEDGKPRWLHEPDREMLVQLYGIDPAPLKKPLINAPKGAAGNASRPPRPGDPIKDFREATIVDAWRQVAKEDQDVVVNLLNGMLKALGLPTIGL